jgi:hypothetical protein
MLAGTNLYCLVMTRVERRSEQVCLDTTFLDLSFSFMKLRTAIRLNEELVDKHK